METRSRAKISGPRSQPRATSEGGTQPGEEQPVTSVDLHVNPSSSATGPTRGGSKPSSRILPLEGGPPRSSNPFPRSESAGGVCGSPEGDSRRRRGQFGERGDASERRTPRLGPKIPAVSSGDAINPPDEEAHDFAQQWLMVQFGFLSAYDLLMLYVHVFQQDMQTDTIK